MESGAVSGGKETATAIQLASIDDHDERFGNAVFRQAAMEQWSRQQAQPAWDSLLDRSQLKRSATVLFCLLGVLLTLGALWPVAAWTGVLRLSNPWLSAPWPREDSLAFRKLPAAWALGAELQLEIVDQRPPLPEEIQVQVREAGSKEGSELNLLARNLGDIAVTTLPPLEGSVEVRAVGGDDLSMPWQRVEVIPVPSIEAHEFSVSAPEYSSLGSKQLSGQRVEVLQGSQVELWGRFGERVKSLRFRFRSDSRLGESSMRPPQSVSSRSEIPSSSLPKVELARDGRSFELVGESGASWSALQSVSWRFEVETKDGLVTELPSLWGIEVVPDLPPEIRWKDPDTRQVSREASIDLAAQVRDDLGLVSVSMFAAKSGGQSNAELAPFPQDDLPSEDDSRLLYSGGLWETSNPSENKQIQVATKWRVENHIDTEDLETFEVWFRASDSLGQFADSDRITVRLRSKAEILNSIAADAEQLAGRIEQVLQSQRRNRQLSLRVSESLQQTGGVDGTMQANLSSISQIQAVVRKQVGLGEGSLVEHAASIVADLEQNQLADATQADEMRLLQAKLQSIANESLAQAQEFASRANLAALEGDAKAKTVRARMEEVLVAQAEAILDLESLLADLSASEAGQAIHRELLSIRDEQAALKANAEDLRLDEIANQNSDKNKRRRGVLSADQRGLARRVNELVMRIREQPSAAAPLNSVADRILKERVSGLMRQSAEEFTQGDTSEAGATQDQTLRALDRALGQFGLSEAKSSSFVNRAQEWKQLGEALGELSEQQKQLADKIGNADSGALASLAEEQKGVLKRTGDQRDAAEAIMDALISERLADAMESQQSTDEGLEYGDAAQASASAQQAAKALEEAAGAAGGKAAEFEQQSKELELARTAEVMRDLAERQAMIIEGLGDAAWDEAGAIDEAGRDSIRAYAADQESIRQDMQRALDSISDETTLRWALDQADKDMARTVAAAQRLRVKPEARDSAKAALSKLELVCETLNQPDSQPQQPKPNDPQEGEQESQEESNRFPPLMTLKLIRGLQDAINQRTAEVHHWELSEAQKNPMIRALAQRQQALAEQLETLLEQLAEQETK